MTTFGVIFMGGILMIVIALVSHYFETKHEKKHLDSSKSPVPKTKE